MRRISATTVVDAPAAAIFELLADPAQHPLIDGSGTVRAARRARRLELGASFDMDMRIGARYRIRNTVVEYEENRLLAWRHFNGHRWRWQLEPLDESRTRVTETFDWTTARHPWAIILLGFPRRNRRAIDRSLALLTAHFAQPSDR
ncbi:SRPBCC family protein [Hamadaea tsunoensis]|uniref:SRPBCC family protein n=1 Tax=Hamadaea tsunoensis TaxID=53368 RepID=UPI0003FEB51A|nr:SRPBCC family protein [Hamadaea tsunoensis]